MNHAGAHLPLFPGCYKASVVLGQDANLEEKGTDIRSSATHWNSAPNIKFCLLPEVAIERLKGKK